MKEQEAEEAQQKKEDAERKLVEEKLKLSFLDTTMNLFDDLFDASDVPELFEAPDAPPRKYLEPACGGPAPPPGTSLEHLKGVASRSTLEMPPETGLRSTIEGAIDSEHWRGGEACVDCDMPRIVRGSARVSIRLSEQNLEQSVEGLRQRIVS